jgi:hypothetical protein
MIPEKIKFRIRLFGDARRRIVLGQTCRLLLLHCPGTYGTYTTHEKPRWFGRVIGNPRAGAG